MSSFVDRRQKLRTAIEKAKADALLVTNFHNVTYLTGFTGDDSYLLVTPEGETLITDMRYATQLEDECPGLALAVRQPGEAMTKFVAGIIKRRKFRRLGIEGQSATVSFSQALAKARRNATLVVTKGLVERLRTIKDAEEIEATRLACRQAREAFEAALKKMTHQQTEADLAAELEYQARLRGAKALSFPAIVAAGARAALPHATPGAQRLGDAPFVLVDWGVNSGLYRSDLTRVVVTARIPPKLRKVYRVVLKAQLAAIEAIRPGVTCEQVDRVARRIIAKAGWGKLFGHGLGHGTGLEIHEAPRLAKGQKMKLQPGMIVTVEPGVYFPGWGGVRIEDDILVTRTGHEVLTDVPKKLGECALLS